MGSQRVRHSLATKGQYLSREHMIVLARWRQRWRKAELDLQNGVELGRGRPRPRGTMCKGRRR